MAEVVLKITGDNTSAENALNETAQTLLGVSTTAKKSSADIKKGFDDVAASAKKANDEMANPKPSENQKRTLDATAQLKKEIRDYTAAAVKAGEGTAEFARNIALAGKKKADLKDLKEAISALDPDAVAKTFLGLASSVAGGFTVAQSAIALTGVKSEELEKTLLKVQAAQGLLAGLQQLANTKDELGKAKIIILNKLQGLELAKINTQIETQIALTGAQSAEVATLTAAKEAQTVANAQLTISQRVLNLVMNSNPVLLLITAIVALSAVVVAYISYTKAAKDAEKARATAIDGTIIKSKELRDAYNETIVTLKEVQNEYDVLNGRISALDAALSNIAERNKIALQEINNETKARLIESGGFWNDLYVSAASSLTGLTKAQVEYSKNADIYTDANNKRLAIETKTIADEAKARLEQAKKDDDKQKQAQKAANDKFLQAEKDFLDALKGLREKARDAEIQSLTGSERIEAERKLNQESIDELEKTIIKKGKLINADFQLSAEQQEQFGIIRNQIDKDANDKLLKQQNDYYNKAKADAESVNQDAIEAATQFINDEQKALEESNKAKVLLTKEGSKERLEAEISAIETERDFILQNTELTTAQRIIVEQEALQKIADLQKDFSDKHQFSLAKLLGITDSEFEKVKAGLSKVAGELKTFIDAQISAQQNLLDNELKITQDREKDHEDNIKSLQDRLKTEQELQKEGLANNVDALNEQIAAEQQAKNADLENEKRIKEEKKKLALAQLAIDSATQVSDLVTASTEIYKSLAILGPIGIGIAVGTIGLMIGSFLSAKQKAIQAINTGFEGGGHTGNMGTKEIAGVVHGQEFVSTAKTTKKHRPLLEALHSEDYSHLTIKDLSPLLAGTGVTFNNEVLKEIRIDQAGYNQRKSEEPQKLLKAMEMTNKNIGKFFNHYKNQPKHTRNADGSITIEQGNTKRTIREK